MSQLTHWDTAKLVAEAHHRDLQHLTKPPHVAEKPFQREPQQPPQRTQLSVLLALIVTLSKR